MSYYVYVTPQCEEHARRFGKAVLEKELPKLENRIKDATDIRMLKFKTDAYPYLIASHAGSYRWIIREQPLKDTSKKLAIILDVVPMDSDFGKFTSTRDSARRYGEKNFEPYVEGIDFDAIVNEGSVPPPPPKPMLSDSETHYIAEPAAASRKHGGVIGDVIYESREWTDEVRRTERVAWLPRIRDAIGDIYTAGSDGVDDGEELRFQIPEHDNNFIAYQWLHNGKDLFLYAIFKGDESPKGAIPMARINDRNLPFFRAYPIYMLNDEDFWMNVEKDPAGNFALSDEEEAFLHAGEENVGFQFPVFINGRAGSGKSTVLQYIYAEYFARWARGGKESNPPAYFACNAELLEHARKFVASILAKNPDYHREHSIREFVDVDRDGNTIPGREFCGAFKEFKECLLNLIPEDERVAKFPAAKYVDYARFYNLWSVRFGHEDRAREEFGPEVSWHVIRTFIKGMKNDGYMSPTEYAQEVPKQYKSVSLKLFARVYDKVWLDWYKRESDPARSGSFWDDQDLVRYVIAHSLIARDAKSLGVFCDESQDFTRVELDALFQLSVFSDRRFFAHQVGKVPYVFAGDEFQTLNPTGFKWDAITAAFTERFIKDLGQESDAKSVAVIRDMRARDLVCNYRSQANIVRYCNAVQLLRACWFKDGNAKPQKEWQWVGDKVRPVSFFYEDDRAMWTSAIKDDDMIFILPCHKGEEIEYVKNDPVLCQYIRVFPESRTTMPKTMSAVRAKGLESTRIAVCGFGKYMLNNGIRAGMQDSDERDVTLEYFMNRLYVAVSRARRQLYIVDSEKGRMALWDQLSDEVVEKWGCGITSNFDECWKGHVAGWKMGDASALIPDSGSLDLKRLAEDIRVIAMRDHDSMMMRYASDFFGKVEKCSSESRLCAAWSSVFLAEETKDSQRRARLYWDAAGLFADNIGIDGKCLDFAVDCLWKAGGDQALDQMVEIADKYGKLSESNLKLKAAVAIVKRDPVMLGKIVSGVLKEVENHGAYAFSSAEWRIVIDKVVSTLGDLPEEGIKLSTNALSELVKRGVVQVPRTEGRKFGDALSRAGDFGRARVFYKAGKVRSDDEVFRRAMFDDVYPAYLEYCNLSADDEVSKVAKDYVDPCNAGKRLTLAQQEMVARVFGKLGELHKIARLLSEIGDAAFFAHFYRDFGGEARNALLEAYAIQIIRTKTAVDAIGWLSEFSGARQSDRYGTRFLVQCMARLSPQPVEGLSEELSKFCGEVFSVLLEKPKAIEEYDIWPELLKASYLFATPAVKKEVNLRAGGKTVEIDGRDGRVSSWDELLSDCLTTRRLSDVVDAPAHGEAESNSNEHPPVSEPALSDMGPDKQITEQRAPVASAFVEPPVFMYLPSLGRLNFASRENQLDQWWADRTGVCRNGQNLGNEVSLTETMKIRVLSDRIVVQDDVLPVNFTLGF